MSHAALGPFSGMRKSNLDLLLPEIWHKTVNKSIKKDNKKIPALQKFYINHHLFSIARPVMKNNFKFGPRSKKSGHPCFIQ